MAPLQKLIAVHGRTLLDGEACPVDVECMEELQSWMEVFSHKEASLLSLAEAVRLLSIQKPLAAALAVIEREEEVYKLQRRSVQQRRILEQLVGDPELLEVHLTQGGGEDRFAVIRQKLERGEIPCLKKSGAEGRGHEEEEVYMVPQRKLQDDLRKAQKESEQQHRQIRELEVRLAKEREMVHQLQAQAKGSCGKCNIM